MGFVNRPIRPLVHGVGAVVARMGDGRAWAPWLVIAFVKAVAMVALARFDILPSVVWQPLLEWAPWIESRIHYPDLALALPALARKADVVVFLSVGVVAQAWTIACLARAWGAAPARLGVRSVVHLVLIAALLVALPAAAVRAATPFVTREQAGLIAAAIGALAAALWFTAPAFVVVHGLGLRASTRASVAMLARLPFAVPLAVTGIAVLHVPTLLLRAPGLRAGAAEDPDWILYTLLAQLPAQALGSFFAAGVSTYFALRTRERKPIERARGLRPAVTTATAVLLLAVTTGCDDSASALSLRFASERWVERARLRADAITASRASGDSLAWLQVASLYERPLQRLDRARGRMAISADLDRDLGRLACRARLGRAGAWARAGRIASARSDYLTVLAQTEFRGARADAALGLARSEDRIRRWEAAYTAYETWLHGVATGEWPLHANALDVPGYVARRLSDRGAPATRERWVETAQQALAAAAARGERARDARSVRFALLVSAQRWEDAFAVLRELRAAHDPDGRDGRLLVAEASLLAGGLRRDDAALGVLRGLNAEGSPFDDQHRVAGWILAGTIHSRRGENASAQDAFQHAVQGARSDAGRSEATLGLARVCAARGDVATARRYYTQLRDVWPATPAGLVAPLEEIRLLRRHGLDHEAHALVPVAQRGYRAVIRRFGTEKTAIAAARCLGESYGLDGRWDQGIAYLDSVSSTFGNDPRAGGLLVLAARLAADKLDDRARAAALLGRLTARFPDSDVAVLARGFADSLLAPSPALDAPHAAP